MRRIGSQRSALSAREHSENWERLRPYSESSSSDSDSEDGEDVDVLPMHGNPFNAYPLHPVLRCALRVPECADGRTLLAVGWYEQALKLSYEAKDTILSAAALVMTGNARGALQAMESHIVTSAVVLFEMAYCSRGTLSPRLGTVQQRYQRLLHDWLACRSAGEEERSQVSSVVGSARAHRVVLLWQLQLVDWTLWRRWYILALMLIAPEERGDPNNPQNAAGPDEADLDRPPPTSTKTYDVPTVTWFRCFFGLQGALPQRRARHDRARHDTHLPDDRGRNRYADPFTDEYASIREPADPLSPPSRSSDQVLAELLAQCGDEEISIITAIAALSTQRYRTAMTFASRFLESTDTGASADVRDEKSAHQQGRYTASGYRVRREDVVMAQFCRCRCALKVAERTQAAYDMTALMRDTDLTVRAVGCALALYGMPLEDAEEVVLACDLPPSLGLYVYALAEYIHALTLLQLGQVEQGMAVAKVAYAMCPSKSLGDELLLIILRCATAMEDSRTVLGLPLTAHCRIYLAVAPAFFGGLQSTGIRLHTHSSTYRLLYPQQLAVQASLRQVLPFHMNRATYFAAQRRYREAWDDTCCAVAAADEIVGSAEFAFTDCFSLQVYVAACHIAIKLLLQLLGEQVEVVLRCAASPQDAALVKEAALVAAANDRFAAEVVRLGTEWSTRAREFFPYSSLVEATQVLWANTIQEPRALTRAALVARRFPQTILAQNTFTTALFFGHRVPEAIDAAQKNLQDFPQDADTLLVQQSLKEKNTVYVFTYRGILPLRYSPANRRRLYTKRMIAAVVLLALHTAFACLTLVANIPEYVTLPDAGKALAVRLQLPSPVPLMFCGVFLIQSLVAMLTPANVIHTLLSDLQFTNTWLTRLLFSMRGVVYANVINCIQISAAGNNFLITHGFFTFLFYLVVTILSVPFTTRMWFLPSMAEPKVGVLSWLTLLSVDAVFAFISFAPHCLLVMIEPFAAIVFNFFVPAKRPSGEEASSSIRRRLLYHERYRYEMPSRYRPGSGSRYVHVRLMIALYRKTHPPLDTAMLNDAQREEENYRAFPLVDPQLTDRVAGQPLRTLAEIRLIFGDGSLQREPSRLRSPRPATAAGRGNGRDNRANDGNDGAGDVSESLSFEMQDVAFVQGAGVTTTGTRDDVVNPLAQVQEAIARDEARQKELVRRTASFVIADARQSRKARRSLFSRDALTSPTARGFPSEPSPTAHARDRHDNGVDEENSPSPAGGLAARLRPQRAQPHRRDVTPHTVPQRESGDDAWLSPSENPLSPRDQW